MHYAVDLLHESQSRELERLTIRRATKPAAASAAPSTAGASFRLRRGQLTR